MPAHDFRQLGLRRARERFNGAPEVTIEHPDGERIARAIWWRDGEDVATELESSTFIVNDRLNFLIEESGHLRTATLCTFEDGTQFRISGPPERERDHEIRYPVERVDDAG